MNIISHLERDQQEVENLIEAFKKAPTVEEKKVLFHQMVTYFKRYNQEQENMMYEMLSNLKTSYKEVVRCYEEHGILYSLLEDLIAGLETHLNKKWEAKMDIFQDILLLHHRHKQRILFPLVRAHINPERLKTLGKEYSNTP